MDKIKLFDSTTFDIEDGASLGHIVHMAKSAAKAQSIAAKITEDNLVHVEFWHDDVLTGVYENLGLTGTSATEEDGADPVQNPMIDGKVVTISLYQK